MGAYLDVINELYTRINSQTASGKILYGMKKVYKGWRSNVFSNCDELPAVVIKFNGTAEDEVDIKRGPSQVSMHMVMGFDIDLIYRDSQTDKDESIDKTTNIITWLEKLHDAIYNNNSTDAPSINFSLTGKPQVRITGISEISGDDIQTITTTVSISTPIYVANNRRA